MKRKTKFRTTWAHSNPSGIEKATMMMIREILTKPPNHLFNTNLTTLHKIRQRQKWKYQPSLKLEINCKFFQAFSTFEQKVSWRNLEEKRNLISTLISIQFWQFQLHKINHWLLSLVSTFRYATHHLGISNTLLIYLKANLINLWWVWQSDESRQIKLRRRQSVLKRQNEIS